MAAKKKSTVIIVLIILLIALAFTIALVVPGAHIVKGVSMEPALTEGDKLAYTCFFGELKGGDIVIIDNHDVKSGLMVKRIIGRPGDTVQMYGNGSVVLNGQLLDEPYARLGNQKGMITQEVTVGDNEYFVLGDNRMKSVDSRDERIGLVDSSRIEYLVTGIERNMKD